MRSKTKSKTSSKTKVRRHVKHIKNRLTKRIKLVKNTTKKIYGGDIERSEVFKKILSIGYELETQSLAKLTLIESANDEQILLNTSSNAKDYEIIKNILEGKSSEEEEEKYENRLEELIEVDAYTTVSIDNNTFIKQDNTTFFIANDVAVTPFTKYLNAFCNLTNDSDENADEDLIDKNDLYTFECDDGEKTYNINFETWGKQDCGTFADVEWIMTYYKPELNENIILNTFINVIKNLTLHLNNLEKTNGKLIMNFSAVDKEIIKKPENRVLYHLPDTNLYYLQTHLLDEKLEIDDICIVPQMTFSCYIKDIVDIFKTLTKDTIRNKNFINYTEIADNRIFIIDNIEKCINKLFESYNNQPNNEYKLIENNNPDVIKSIKNYMFMILFKLQRYFNNYLTDEKVKNKSKTAKYLKDTLFFNSRHTNYDLYKSLKESLSKYFSNKLDDNTTVSIIQNLMIQQPILEKYLIVDDNAVVRKNAFSVSNKLDKNNKHYGDPYYSLRSYFDFFENPIDDPDNRNDKDEIFHDWLQYIGVDLFSSTTDIKDNIVLVEIRSFARMLSTYMYDIANDELKNSMTNGICNRLKKYYQPDITGFTLSSLKKFIELYERINVKV